MSKFDWYFLFFIAFSQINFIAGKNLEGTI